MGYGKRASLQPSPEEDRRMIGTDDETRTETRITIEQARGIVMLALDGWRAVKPEPAQPNRSSRTIQRS